MLHIDTVDLRLQEIDFSDPDTIFDINAEFLGIKVKNTKYNHHMVEHIDSGKLLDNAMFIDRFGMTRPLNNLSTGCKAAILLGTNPSKRISALECGMNALLEIVTHITNGRILIYNPMNGILYYKDNEYKIDVQVDQYRFTSLSRLNYYFTDERPFDPDMSMEGIEYAQI